jgi:hypothetical protein
MARGVRDGLLGDAEQLALDLGGQIHVHGVERHLDVVPAPPRVEAALDGGRERELLIGVGAEIEHLVAERIDVADRERPRVLDDLGAARHVPLVGRAAGGRQHHVEADHLLDRPVVQGLRQPAADVVLGPQRAAADLPGLQARRRLLGAEPPDEDDGRERGGGEGALVEDQEVALDGQVVVEGAR